MLDIKGENMNKFKLGDVVEILNNNHRYSEDFTGQITEIIEVFGDCAEGSCYNVQVRYKNGLYMHLTFNAKNLKLIRSADVEESQAEIHEQSSKTKSDGGSSDYYKLEINGNPVEVEEILTIVDDSNDAASILQQAKDCLVVRGVERDKPNGERSMKSTVEAFNALTGHSLSESNGWLFMLCLKAARAEGGCFKADDYVDGAAYFALYGEAAAKEANES